VVALGGARILASDPENSRPSFVGYATTTQSVANLTNTEMLLNAELLDTHNWHSTVSNTARIVPTIPGYYDCLGMIAWATSTAGDRNAQFRKNGAQLDGSPYGPVPALNGTVFLFGGGWAMGTIFCNGTTDYISLWGNQNTGGAINTAYAAGQVSTWCRVTFLHG
jgi:hypothetical protein